MKITVSWTRNLILPRRQISARLLAAVAVFMLLSNAQTGFAQQNPSHGALEASMYAGGSLGMFQLGDYCDNSFGASCDDGSLGVGAFYGYRFNEHFAIEAGFETIPGLVEESTTVVVGVLGEVVVSSELDALQLWFAAKGMLPVHPRVSLFGKLGVMRWDVSQELSGSVSGFGTVSETGSDDGFDLFYGVGANFNVHEEWLLMLEYTTYDIDAATRFDQFVVGNIDSDVTALVFRFAYRF